MHFLRSTVLLLILGWSIAVNAQIKLFSSYDDFLAGKASKEYAGARLYVVKLDRFTIVDGTGKKESLDPEQYWGMTSDTLEFRFMHGKAKWGMVWRMHRVQDKFVYYTLWYGNASDYYGNIGNVGVDLFETNMAISATPTSTVIGVCVSTDEYTEAFPGRSADELKALKKCLCSNSPDAGKRHTCIQEFSGARFRFW